jgi:hypothetical protein
VLFLLTVVADYMVATCLLLAGQLEGVQGPQGGRAEEEEKAGGGQEKEKVKMAGIM